MPKKAGMSYINKLSTKSSIPDSANKDTYTQTIIAHPVAIHTSGKRVYFTKRKFTDVKEMVEM